MKSLFLLRLRAFLIGVAALLLLYLVDEWLFTRWMGIHYWRWYLKNGALIGLVSSILLRIWGNGADKHLGLISTKPFDYFSSWIQFVSLPLFSLGTELSSQRRNGMDSVLTVLWCVVLVPVLLAWLIVIVPLQFLVYFVCGAPARYGLDSDRVPLARFVPHFDDRIKLDYNQAKRYSLPELLIFDFKDARGLIRKLLGADDRLSVWLRGQLSSGLIEGLKKEQDSKEIPKPLILSLVEELNALLQGESIYDEQRFSGVILTEKLRKSVDPAEKAEKQFRLNRSLLEEAFPDEIELSYTEERFDSWWDASLSRNPVSMTNALGALLMFGLQKIV